MKHQEIIQLIIAYTLAGAFVFTVIVTCASLVGWIRLADKKQQNKLFTVLIVQLVGVCIAFFTGWLRFDAGHVADDIGQRAVIAVQLKNKPPLYGNSDDGNVRPDGGLHSSVLSSQRLGGCKETATPTWVNR